MTDFNTKLDDLAAGMLQLAKKNLSKDGHLMPVAFVVTKDFEEVKIIALKFDGFEQKRKAYDAVTRMAIESEADAIITINDVRYKKLSKENAHDFMATRHQGDICDNEENPEALVMSVLPRHGAEYAVMVNYIRAGNNIIYAEEKRLGNGPTETIKMNLIPQSWRQAVTARNN